MRCGRCGKELKEQGPSSAARHVQYCLDLKPYTCTAEACRSVRFGTKVLGLVLSDLSLNFELLRLFLIESQVELVPAVQQV